MTALPTISNLFPSDPSLADLLELHRKSVMLATNCHALGTIQTFNPVNQTATVTINYKRSYLEFNPALQNYVTVLKDYPVLTDCPVGSLGGGTAALTFPIAPGDECLVLFNDRDIDNWFAGSSSSPVASPRMHSFSDGLVLVGFRSLPNVLLAYDASRAVLGLGGPTGAKVAVGPVVEISVASQTLGAKLQTLISTLETLNTAIATFGGAAAAQTPPVPSGTALATAANVANTSLTAVATALTGILA